MKKFITAISIFSLSNMVYILLHKFITDAANKHGPWSLETWIVSIIVWLLGVLATYLVLLTAER